MLEPLLLGLGGLEHLELGPTVLVQTDLEVGH